MVEHSAVTNSCSFRGKPRLKNQVNSGKPRLRSRGNPEPSSEAGKFREGAETIPKGSTSPDVWGWEAPESVIRVGGMDMI